MEPKANVERLAEISRNERAFAAECEMLRAEFNATQEGKLRPIDSSDKFEFAESPKQRWQEWRDAVELHPQAALCLSGGGIRSATFSLGVVQELAEIEWLAKFDYLSTVSGGGYLGSFISAWTSRKGFDAMNAGLRNPVKAPPDDVNNPIGNLRAYSNYLSPMWGMSADLFTLLATYLRNLTLIWLQIIPLLCAVLMLPRLLFIAIEHAPSRAQLFPNALAGGIAATLAAFSLGYMVSDLRLNQFGSNPPKNQFVSLCLVPLVLAAILGCWAIAGGASSTLMRLDSNQLFVLVACMGAGLIVHLLGEGLALPIRYDRKLEPIDAGPTHTVKLYLALSGLGTGAMVFCAAKVLAQESPNPGMYATLCVPLALAGFWLVNTIAAGVTQRWTADGYREWWARAGGYSLAFGIGWLALFGLAIYGPELVLDFLARKFPSTASTGGVGAMSALVGLATSAFGFWSHNGGRVRQMASRLGTHALEALAGLFILLLALFLCLGIAGLVTCRDGALAPSADCSAAFTLQTQVAPSSADVSIHLQSVAAADIRLISSAVKSCHRDASAASTGSKESPFGSWYRHSFTTDTSHDHIDPESANNHADATWVLFGAFLGIGLLSSFFFGTNVFSLHGMYKNRLERAYLGASNSERRPHWFTGFDDNDNRSMTELPGGLNFEPDDGSKNARTRLYPIINIALNLTRPSKTRLSWQQRKSASFTVTPRVAGSSTLGYVDVATYADLPWRRRLDVGNGKHPPPGMSLARAMTISGAAASPNMGYHTSTLVAFAMTFFNARLGWWAPNPRDSFASVRSEKDREPAFSLSPMLSELTGSASEDNKWVYLSDGGHFENLGLYEMIRRRCRNILVVDAGCDPKYTYEDVENALRKIRIDFGVPIDLDVATLPRPRSSRKEWGQRVVTATIRYSAVDGNEYADGTLTLIKPLLLGNESVDVLRYAASRPSGESPFPQETTADQFFSEAQFESYRTLGQQSVKEGLKDEWPPRAVPPFEPPTGPQFPPLPPLAARPAVSGDAKATGAQSQSARSSGLLAGASRQAVLVAGLGAGAAAGVGGASYFGGGTLQLDDSDRQLLTQPIKVGPIPTIKLDPAASAAFTGGISISGPSVTNLGNQLTQTLNQFIIDHPYGDSQNQELIKVLSRLSATLDQHIRVDANLTGAKVSLDETQVNRIFQAINRLRSFNEPDGAASQAKGGSTADLKSILDELKQIEGDLDAASPAHNIHATGSQGPGR